MMKNNNTAYILRVAHSRGIITTWPPLLTRYRINKACLEYGRAGVLPSLQHEWRRKNPTINYCWVVSEIAYRLVMPEGTTAWQIDHGNDRFHWFLKDPEGRIVDLTFDQFASVWDIPDYEKAKHYKFRDGMSRRGKQLAKLLELSPRDS